MLRYVLTIASTLLLPTFTAFAQHAGDVHFHYNNTSDKILISDGEFAPSGARYFEGDFNSNPFIPLLTPNPGFETTFGLGRNPVTPNDIIGLKLHQAPGGNWLTVFDAALGQLVETHDYSINFEHSGMFNVDIFAHSFDLHRTSFYESFGFPEDFLAIAQASGSGTIHQHHDFRLSSNAPTGAYGFMVSLASDRGTVADSDPFWLIFNKGMTDPDFHNAISSITAVPEPNSLLALAGMALTGCLLRRRSRA